jgi:hypothetical protein
MSTLGKEKHTAVMLFWQLRRIRFIDCAHPDNATLPFDARTAGMVSYSVMDPRPAEPAKAMNNVTLQLSEHTERKLRERARRLGQTLEVYLQLLAEKAVENGPSASQPDTNGSTPAVSASEEFPKFIARPTLTADEMEKLLDQFSAGPPGKVLPADFSRADIYDDHD